MKTTQAAVLATGIWVTLNTGALCATFQQTAQMWAERKSTTRIAFETTPPDRGTRADVGMSVGQNRFSLRKESYSSVESAADAAASPAEFCRILAGRVKYVADTVPAEEWKLPETTWADGRGDCEDYALCVKRFCERKGISADVRVYTCTKTGKSHAIVVGEWNGRKWFSSNAAFSETVDDQDVRECMARFFGCGTGEVREGTGAASRVAGTEGHAGVPRW